MKNILLFLLIFNFFYNFSKADELMNQGKQIFLNQGNCSSCHILSDAKSDGHLGPNLNEIMPTKERVLAAVTRGIGVMPAYEGVLTAKEIEAVSHYVSKIVEQ